MVRSVDKRKALCPQLFCGWRRVLCKNRGGGDIVHKDSGGQPGEQSGYGISVHSTSSLLNGAAPKTCVQERDVGTSKIAAAYGFFSYIRGKSPDFSPCYRGLDGQACAIGVPTNGRARNRRRTVEFNRNEIV